MSVDSGHDRKEVWLLQQILKIHLEPIFPSLGKLKGHHCAILKRLAGECKAPVNQFTVKSVSNLMHLVIPTKSRSKAQNNLA